MRRRTLGSREVVEKEKVVMVKHRQAELGAGLRFLCKLESRGLSLTSLNLSWPMTLGFPAFAIFDFERGLNSTGVYQRALVSVESQSPQCILVFLTPWLSSTLVRLCRGELGWSGSW